MRLTWHFYLTWQVRSWRNKWFMNVILQTLIDWFLYGKGILTHHPPTWSWIWRSITIGLCHNKKKVRKWAQWCDIAWLLLLARQVQGGVVVDRDCTLGLAASDTQESSLRTPEILMKLTMSSNIDWSRKVHAYAAILAEGRGAFITWINDVIGWASAAFYVERGSQRSPWRFVCKLSWLQ